ncbi:hypothetical protein FSARC_14784 [Fusarium sarcochroum]|uniref:poly(ADP-ribose) glycohydrolase n=1 Tax=Fusarium sarcochroum TaxID=1208366 RepID=A0A8H4SQV9_9HYPO|nr:hypothetical protein FSARC_14784 [Fusarium sarcochroum]
MSSRPSAFILPNSTSCRIIDRFSDLPDDVQVEEDEAGRIPFWPLLQHLLYTPVSGIAQLIDRLQSIAAIAETYQDNDYAFLTSFLEVRAQVKLFGTIWPKIRGIALDLPVYFPHGQLEPLRPGRPIYLSRGQVACLVIHQFLCSPTPQRNDDGCQDLGIWFSSEQRHPAAVQMYLEALFTYFESLPEAHALLQDHQAAPNEVRNVVTYELHEGKQVSLVAAELIPVHVSYLDTHTTDTHNPDVQGKGGAVVVSANKVIGFGQSATQEELFVGIAPEAYPVVLVAPHLTDHTVITVSGTRAMVDAKGQRREVEWKVRPTPSLDEGIASWMASWQGGRLVFMDALEMDMLEGSFDNDLPDLHPENIDREIRKATVGLASYRGDRIFTGLWGCGAFGGDPGVKLILLWLAAAAAKVELHIMLGPGEHELGKALEGVVKACKGFSAEDVRGLLSKTPQKLRHEGILKWIEAAASGAR